MTSAIATSHALSRDSKSTIDASKLSYVKGSSEPETEEAPLPPRESERHRFYQSALDFCGFLDRSPSVYHAVEQVNERLRLQGFQKLREQDSWSSQLQPGGKYYVVRNDMSGASVIAFAVGKLWKPGNPFAMVATHVDSPCLKIKPVSKRYRSPFYLAGVQTYGGGLWHTWFDRDLSAAGRVMIRTPAGTIESRLVDIGLAMFRIPTLAVHYEKQNPFKFNTELDLLPVTGMSPDIPLMQRMVDDEYDGQGEILDSAPKPTSHSSKRSTPTQKRHGGVADLVAGVLSVHPEEIVDFDLSLYDTQRASLGGGFTEFIFSSRIDNLMMTYCALEGFTRSLSDWRALNDESSVRLVAMFDNEEISSGTQHGGRSNFLINTLRRITNECEIGAPQKSAFERSMAKSFLISADMIHGTHPHHHGLHETNHSIWPNGGLAISSDNGRHLVKNTPGTALILEIARYTESGMPFEFQLFTRPNNVNCGSTLGPILSTQLGVRTVDMGNAQLSMHSIREQAGTWDVEHATRYMHLFFEKFSEVDKIFDID
ncbi:aspartyl aminopeptidase [Rhizodiscina lignyota]|uniref:Aspartyl aminopeptidase n=1 Tax=Rhizodiscina lignyota TaxID=1504668 RepID=A0A9P4IIS7_9PEZI|nr:aspartyl aminopeptidase [Rhizodiscina lignyota]